VVNYPTPRQSMTNISTEKRDEGNICGCLSITKSRGIVDGLGESERIWSSEKGAKMYRSIRFRSTTFLTITIFLIVMPAIAAVAQRSPQAFPEVQKVQEERGVFREIYDVLTDILTIILATLAVIFASLSYKQAKSARNALEKTGLVKPEEESAKPGNKEKKNNPPA